MSRSSPIIEELAPNLAKVMFTLKYLVKLRRYFAECFNVNITLARFGESSLMMVED